MDFVSIIGILASIFITLGYLPQAIRTVRTRSTDDIALGTFLCMGIGSICFMIQGYMLGLYPLAIANTITSVSSAIILIIKLQNDYGKKGKAKRRKN